MPLIIPIILALGLIVVTLVALFRWNRTRTPQTEMIRHAIMRLDKRLSATPTKAELINAAEQHWGGQTIGLHGNGIITACAGPNSVIWRDSGKNAHIICLRCAQAKINEVTSPADDQACSNAAFARMKAISQLKLMHIRANYAPQVHKPTILGNSPQLRHEKTGMPDFFTCDCC